MNYLNGKTVADADTLGRGTHCHDHGSRVTMGRPPPLRIRILATRTDEPMSTLQLTERACITAGRRGEVVKPAFVVLEDEWLIERVDGRLHPK